MASQAPNPVALAAPEDVAMTEESSTIQLARFTGDAKEDYGLWKIRAVALLEAEGLYSQFGASGTDAAAAKAKGANILVQALGDAPLRVCMSHTKEPLKMLESLDTRYGSRRVSSRISQLTEVCQKRYTGQNMANYVDDFSRLFASLEQSGEDAKVPDTLKVVILLASLRNQSAYDSFVSSTRLRDERFLTWEIVSVDLIHEARRLRRESSQSRNKADSRSRHAGGQR